jgi:hypothetical protein
MEPVEAVRYQAYWERQAAFQDLQTFRSEVGGIPAKGGSIPDGGTLARIDSCGNSFYGMSAHGQPMLIGNGFTYTHAELDALQQAFMAGKLGPTATIYVDNDLCIFCQRGLPKTLMDLDMQELIIHDPVNSWRITPTGTVNIPR